MDMVERVARAIYEHQNSARGGVWWGVDERDRLNVWYPLAYAAIKAMREPTEAMLIDGAAKIRNFTSANGPYPRTRAVWLSMIDASLANYPVKPDSSTGRQGDEK
jgi:hypothetical protein